MRGAISPFHNTPSLHGAQLKHRDKFAFTLQRHFKSLLVGIGWQAFEYFVG
jgi:hypothetical protein